MTNEEKIKDLELKIAEVEKAITQNVKAIDTAQQRLTDAQARVESIKGDHQAAREARQRILALKEDPTKINLKVSKAKDAAEQVEDEITGLENLLAELQEERDRLPVKKEAIRCEIVILRLKPLVDRWNQQGAELAMTASLIYELSYELPGGFSPLNASGPRPIVPSSWEGALDRIPQLFWVDDLPAGTKVQGKDLFDQRYCYETWKKKRELKEKLGA